jgi:DedD protein
MDDALKRRLTGAVVLVSLAVIFVPMLVEDEPVLSPSIRESNIPVRPPPVLIDPESRRPPPPAAPDAGTADAGSDAVAALSLPAPEKAAETSAAEVPPAAPEAAPPEPVEERVTEMPPPPAEPAPAVAEPEPPKAPEKPAAEPAKASKPPSGWVVQVGTFADKGNAERTLERLRASGYDSFIEETRVSGKTMYRVRVGPEIQRARAEAHRAGILAKFKLKGQVLKYP